jgi:hypothetical protein
MLKQLLAPALVATLFLPVAPLAAGDAITPYTTAGQAGPLLYKIYNNRWLMKRDAVKRVAITGVSPDAKGEFVIPPVLDGIEVYGIDDNAFKNAIGITSISIPKSVRFLKAGTLNRCKGLKTIIVDPDHPELASVDGLMFDKQRTKLLAVGSGHRGHFDVPEITTVIDNLAFSLCTELESVAVPDSVVDIGGFRGAVFLGCTSLKRVEFPDTVTNIGQKSFQDCGSLQQITIPPKVTAIPFGVFWRCRSLGAMTIPEGITKIGNYAFADCANLKVKQLPASLTEVGAYAFKDCKGLKGLAVPATLTTIGRNAFRGCDVTLPEKR